MRAAVPLFLLLATTTLVAEQRPNIIYIMADDLGYGDVGFNGQQQIKTPNLDRMAREGMVFTNHYAGSPVCMPSRAVLLTGKHVGHARIRGNPVWTTRGRPIDLQYEDVTVAEELKRAGYKTGVVGKWGLSEDTYTGLPTRQGFDYFFGFKNHRDAHHYYWPDLWENERIVRLEKNDYLKKEGQYVHDLLSEAALRFVEENQSSPFFLYLAYTIPHAEYTVPEDSKAPYRNLGWPERPMRPGHYRHDEEGNLAWAGMISRLDRDIGRILARLKDLAIDENTLVIFTSDNGPPPLFSDSFFDSNGPFRGAKRDVYEGGIRVPFVARWPAKVPAGETSAHISAFWDFLPTACELAGVRPTDEIDGISYLPTLLGKPQNQREHDFLYWEFNEQEGPVQAVRSGNWKAVKWLERPIELYDLSQDIGETKDVAAEHPGEADRLLSLIRQARTDDPNFKLERIRR